MKVIKGGREELCRRIAGEITMFVGNKPDCVLALSAAPDLMGVYAELVKSGADFSRCLVFLTEEFTGVDEDEQASRWKTMDRALLTPAHFSRWNVYVPAVRGKLDEECQAYDRMLEDAGGIDLALVAMGVNGHVAFNEPLTAFDSGTHAARLTESTRREEWPGDFEDAPAMGTTVGIRSLMHARNAVMVGFGRQKAETARRTVAGVVHVSVPSSLMQMHENVKVYLDHEAASLLD